MNARKILLLATMCGALSILAGFAMAFQLAQAKTSTPRTAGLSDTLPLLGPVPEFVFTSTTGERANTNMFADKVWVADFFFTTCTGPCPQMSANMAGLVQRFEKDDRVHFLSISVNPEYDTPEVLKDYATGFEADITRWHFAHAPLKQVHALATEGFKIGSLDSPMVHSTRFVLVDGEGQIRGYYMGTDPSDVNKLATDIGRLLEDRM